MALLAKLCTFFETLLNLFKNCFFFDDIQEIKVNMTTLFMHHIVLSKPLYRGVADGILLFTDV